MIISELCGTILAVAHIDDKPMQRRILVLDDDADLLEIMDILLDSSGYEVLTLSRGELIMENIIAFKPDLILMDVMLAGMDGREICKLIKADKSLAIPVILISGTHNLKQIMNYAGAPNDFINKPFDLDDLLKRVDHQLC